MSFFFFLFLVQILWGRNILKFLVDADTAIFFFRNVFKPMRIVLCAIRSKDVKTPQRTEVCYCAHLSGSQDLLRAAMGQQPL